MITRGTWSFITDRPLVVSFEVTHSCTADCKHCDKGGIKPEPEGLLKADDYRRLRAKLKPMAVQLSGGEPLLRKDLEEIVRARVEEICVVIRPGDAEAYAQTAGDHAGAHSCRFSPSVLPSAGTSRISSSISRASPRAAFRIRDAPASESGRLVSSGHASPRSSATACRIR